MSESTLPPTTTGAERAVRPSTSWFASRQAQRLREYGLAYLFLLPAIVIIGLFGLFPLVFALYQSTRRGLNNINGPYDGMYNYVRAIDNLAYVLAFALAIFFAAVAVVTIMRTVRLGRETQEVPWLFLPAGLGTGAAISITTRWLFQILSPLLETSEQVQRIQGPEKAIAFRRLVVEALRDPVNARLWWTAVVLLALSIGLYAGATRLRRRETRSGTYFGNFVVVTLSVVGAAFLVWFTLGEIQAAYAEALEDGEQLALWAQIITILAGFVLLAVSWLIWRSASHQDSNRKTMVRVAAAALLMIGAWVLIGELPRAVGSGDDDWWNGLRATVFYSVGTIPIQLALSLWIAVMLFQDLKGKTLLRILYFLPYITPVVAASAVFRVFFSPSPTAPMNNILSMIGVDGLRWLAEPVGVVQLIVGDGREISNGWLAGPSLALVVVMLFGIWRFIGFNVVVFLAGLGNISRELYEAASIDGADRWAQFRSITMPLLSPTIYFLTLWAVIGTFKAFNSIWVLRLNAALGTTDTASVVIFQTIRENVRYGYASALGVLLLIIILILTYINNRIAEERVFYG